MSVRIYIKDCSTGDVHEYGTDRHDSLILRDDGSLEYYNYQNGDGSKYGAYKFCLSDGSKPSDEFDNTIDLGGELTGVDCWKCKNFPEWCNFCKRYRVRRDLYAEDEEAVKAFQEQVAELIDDEDE